MNSIIKRIKEEPVIVVDLVKAVMVLLIAFGVVISSAQVAAIVGVIWAVLTFVTRAKVTPNEKIKPVDAS